MHADTTPPRVYIVDADPVVRATHRRLMRSLGYRVQDFSTAGEFLASADLEAPGCALLEVELTDLHGGEVQAHLKTSGSPISVVYVTTCAEVPTAVEAIRQGAANYLLKPVREQVLLDVVNRALRSSSEGAQAASARRSVQAQLARLTPRELDVLAKLVEGVQYDDVSSSLGITKRTVEAHRRRIMDKMEARTLPQLLRELARVGWPMSKTPRPMDRN